LVSAVLSARSLLVCRVLTPLLCRVLTPLLCVPLRLPLRLLGCSMRRLSVGPRISRVIACTVAVVVVGAWVLSPCASILLVRRVPRGVSWVSVVLSLRMLAPPHPAAAAPAVAVWAPDEAAGAGTGVQPCGGSQAVFCSAWLVQ
jgi:hypothetical protein